jgi:two-component system, LytTR family, response regulator AlgR
LTAPQPEGAATPLRVLIVDDEPPARARLRDLLDDCRAQVPNAIVGEAGNGLEGLDLLASNPADVALVDIQMPGMSGMEFARHLQLLPAPPAVIFVTAHDRYAVEAFELNAVDYLLKPVRSGRIAAALKKAVTGLPLTREVYDRVDPHPRRFLSVNERGRLTLVPLIDVLYLKAELKYVTVRTCDREYLIEESLARLEEEFAALFIRIHRNCLVARRRIRGFERAAGDEAEANWAIMLEGCEDKLPVSRRQWAQVKALVKA